jgi:fluoride ion exporter CrcB/FEX
MIYQYALLGFLGGVARASVGLLKAMRKNEEIHWGYTTVTIISSGIIGSAAGILLDSDPKLSLVAGYVGTDVLEGFYKIIFKKAPIPHLPTRK